jgi:hypothetical protein
LVVVAGAARASRTSVVDALLGMAPPVSGLPSAASPYLVFRYGERPTAHAFIPGHPRPRPVGLDGLRGGDPVPAGSPGSIRPPRRIEVTYPAELLRHLTLVEAPGADEPDREVVLDAAGRGAGLLLAVPADTRLTPAELDLLAGAGRRQIPVVFAVTGIDRNPSMVGVNHAAVRERAPELVDAAWIAVDPAPGQRAGVDALSQVLADLAARHESPDTRAGHDTCAGSAGSPPPAPAVTATGSAGDERWQQILDREIRDHRVGVLQRLAIDLATLHVRGVQEIGSGHGCAGLPGALDRELHALSVRLTRALDRAARHVAGRVFGALLDAEPDPAVLRRIAAAVRREMGGEDRVLLLTATSGAAVLSGPAALAGLSAVAVPAAEPPVFGALAIGLTAGCFLYWQRRTSTDKQACRYWLQQVVHVVEVELQRELNQRFADLREAIAAIAADTVDHGVLLA